jgi:AcrR family transcriptional regulator
MDPTAELRKRKKLLDVALAYVDRVGIVGMTMEGLAEEAAVSADELHGFFESRDEVVIALIARNRTRLREAFAEMDVAALGPIELGRAMWRVYQDDVSASRIFMEAYSLALHDENIKDYLHGVNDWVDLLVARLEVLGVPRDSAAAFATLTLTIFRGAFMDLAATGERARVTAAMELYFEMAARFLGA